MAAVSHSATALTPSTGSYGTGYSWSNDPEKSADDENAYPSGGAVMSTQNGNPAYGANTNTDPPSRKHSNGEYGLDMKGRGLEPPHLSVPQQNDLLKSRGLKDNASPADSLLDLYDGTKGDRADESNKRTVNDMQAGSVEENSKWIHRDKLAKIENEELQAAGIFLPKARERARSKSQTRARRDQSQDKFSGHGRAVGGPDQTTGRSRKNSTNSGDQKSPDLASSSVPAWDLRLPEEIHEDGDGYWVSAGGVRGSRIPVAKLSPVPIPSEHLERDTLMIRKQDSPTEDDTMNYPKQRARSGSTANSLGKTVTNGPYSQQTLQSNKRVDSSPRKTTPTVGGRKASALKPANGAAGRPRTRGGPSKDSTSSAGGTTRPSTRSGERELSPPGTSGKQMEGEPPWMVSAYRPDPRLPPEQQLLPTVARRLQQEKWEREGKFGNVYDKEFRPLSDEGFLKPPELDVAPEQDVDNDEDQGDWPLKTGTKSPTPQSGMPGRTGSYSTMPKITDKPPTMSPLPSPRAPLQAPQIAPAVRLPEPREEPSRKKDGCGCCIVM
ncbi:hypothetical protein B0T22DRAFT_231446 [Podospora appendiculata]|uniref:TeaA receptor TeaR n=1 Tax=Podospora appendiculata TaxID=314037 RepID=A0AAE0X6E8_9PEZI|nr:hypothetical protein B0T22DRAFT_231446 [Podospora appendiculata]